MRKIIVPLTVSLDGYFEGPDHDISWGLVDDERHNEINDYLRPMSAFIMGRTTYELMADFWPTADQDPESTAPMLDFMGIWNQMPRIVYSRTLEEADPNTTIRREVDRDEVLALKAQPGGDMSLGGPNLAAEFLAQGLIDEYRLYLTPVVLGAGTPLFAPGTKANLSLEETRSFPNGTVMLRYRVD